MMKRLSYLIILSFIFLTITSLAQQKRSYKRGIAYNIPYVEDLPVLSKGVSWYYNWGHTPVSAVYNDHDQYLDFLPMAWNNIDTTVMKNFLSTHPNVKYILGFNEPNFKQQANLTPTQAAARWPAIEKIADRFNLKIVGPAVNYGPSNGSVTENGVTYTDPVRYLDDFFAVCPDCRVDYIAVHNYMNTATAVESYIGLFKKYNRPIWLTEFCAWQQNQGLTADKQKDYMVEVLTYLENDPDVYRYAWFIGRNNSGENAFPYMALLTNTGKGILKELGDIYVNMSPFDRSYYYAINEKIEAEHFSNSHSVSLRRIDEISGDLYLNDFYFKDWTTYQVEIPEEKEYIITINLACPEGTVLQILNDEENVLSNQEMASTGGLTTWGLRSMTVTLPAGKQTIKLKSAGEGCHVNWLKVGTVDTSVDTPDDIPIALLYPNPVTDVLHINSTGPTEVIKIFDPVGKIVYRGTDEKQIDTGKMIKGIYLVQLTFQNGQKQSAIIYK